MSHRSCTEKAMLIRVYNDGALTELKTSELAIDQVSDKLLQQLRNTTKQKKSDSDYKCFFHLC